MFDDIEILVAEDDDLLREQVLIPGLQQHGFRNVAGVGSAIETYRAMLSRSFGVIVLDVCLPDENGFEVTRNLRAVSDAGILLLSDYGVSARDQVMALDEGADAFLSKSTDMGLLAATIRSVLRRRGNRQTDEAKSLPSGRTPAWGITRAQPPPAQAWQLESFGWALHSPLGRTVRLTHPERLLIGLLFKHKGDVVTREAITACLSEHNPQFEPHRIEMIVHRLRRKVLDQTGEEVPISAVRGSGYVLAL